MQLDELPCESQAESGAFRFLVRGAHLAELLEHRLVILRRDADPSVADRHLDRSAVRNSRHVDPAAFRRELDRVRQQVQEHLADRKSTRLNSSHSSISYAVFCL